MSIELMARVWKNQNLQDATALNVMLALADWANDEGVCWPRMATLAGKARLSERAVKRVVDRLHDAQFLTKKHARRDPSQLVFALHPERGNLLTRKTRSDAKTTENEAPESGENEDFQGDLVAETGVTNSHGGVTRSPNGVTKSPNRGDYESSLSNEPPNDTSRDTSERETRAKNPPSRKPDNPLSKAIAEICRINPTDMGKADTFEFPKTLTFLRTTMPEMNDAQRADETRRRFSSWALPTPPRVAQIRHEWQRTPSTPPQTSTHNQPRFKTAAERNADNAAACRAITRKYAVAAGFIPAEVPA